MHSLLAFWPPPCQAMIPPGSSLCSLSLLPIPLWARFSSLFQTLSCNQNNLIFQFFFSTREPHALFFFLNGPTTHSCVSSFVFLLCILAHIPQEGSGLSYSFLSEGTRVNLGLQEDCTLSYFMLTVFCLLSQALHASIHWGSWFSNHQSFSH
jgi:hypothetical protein